MIRIQCEKHNSNYFQCVFESLKEIFFFAIDMRNLLEKEREKKGSMSLVNILQRITDKTPFTTDIVEEIKLS